MTDDVLGPKSQQLKRLKRLGSQASARRDEGLMIVEGPTLVAEALGSSLVVHAVYLEESMASPAGVGSVTVERVRDGVLAGVLPSLNPQPVAAVVSRPRASWNDLRSDRPVLVIVDGRDPGNVGTLWRTAEAAGFAGVVLVGTSVDPTNPKVVRASAGAALRLPLLEVDDVVEAFARLRSQGRSIHAATLAPDAVAHDRVELARAAIVLGNEAHGLPDAVIGLADGLVAIEMDGPTESLNVAAAGAVLCFEALRQRRGLSDDRSPLTHQTANENPSPEK
jgi:RNA methyltransferase, TrmH family